MLGLNCSTHGIHCCTWDLVLRQGIEPGLPALGMQSLSHWTSREVPVLYSQTKFLQSPYVLCDLGPGVVDSKTEG